MHPRARLAAAYSCPWTVYGMSWRNCHDEKMLAVTSFTEEYTNHLQVLKLSDVSGADFKSTDDGTPAANDDMDVDEGNKTRFTLQSEAIVEHPYPATKVLWSPDSNSSNLATTADYLRIWHTQGDTIQCSATLSKYRARENCSPLTSADWNTADPHILGTSSVDTTICIWDLNNTKAPQKEIVAHDGEVYDMAFSTGTNIFASVGGDGSLRVFDLRSLGSCTVLYETVDVRPLIRLAWNKLDTNYIAVVLAEGPAALILDLRLPSIPIMELPHETGHMNAIAWSPTSPHYICTVGEQHEALMWDISQSTQERRPVLGYHGGAPINQVQWSSTHPEFLAMGVDKTVHVVTV
ncbi:Aste57867_9114 [Aphanomyces stellatus]|uniref:Aste57867_9114 protein n=1 Tax=Aphanomyces stellatus TaxID=120398 RepID=A0A485KM84_9STRA|nr:hypothetical protein As57867_009078 [Aphanomyces stellatus]VFT85998.1 Aste57867_9114 [Aphanomyces stellatus]